MIKRVDLKKFKRLKDNSIEIRPEAMSLLAGGNNSGKSTLLHAIAVWEFCKLILRIEKGEEALYDTTGAQGLGLSAEEFLPIAIPSLKHMWTNLKTQKEGADTDGYNLKIKCVWDLVAEKFLEIGLSLVNDRLFIKVTDTNLLKDDKIPSAAYLPTFAGILERENKVSLAERRKFIGKGLAGSVLRNLLLELSVESKKKRAELKGTKVKITAKDLKIFKKTDPYEVLLTNIRSTFRTGLRIKDFNDLYHTSIKIESFKGEFNTKGVFKKFTTYNYRDLMVEGSGFLQWLNVFTLCLNPEIDVLLLDEPDSHLHPSLQMDMVFELQSISQATGKQILIATHSSEIIKSIDPENILNVSDRLKYLTEENQKIGLLSGIGSTYSPKLDKLKHCKKVLFIEGEIDLIAIYKASELIGTPLTQDFVPWISATGHKERKNLFLELRKEIPELKGISLRDRDDETLESVDVELDDKTHSNPGEFLKLMKWKRRNIESYLIFPELIAQIGNIPLQDVKDHLANEFGIAIPANFTDHSIPEALLRIDGKNLLKENANSIENKFKVSRHQLIESLSADKVCDDIKKMIEKINEQFA